MKEITIIGGGLSGLGLASGLRAAGVPVKLYEAGHYPRHRVCGEFLTSLKQQTLEDLNIHNCLSKAVIHRTTGWYKNGRRIKSFALPTAATGISRFYMDEWLVQHVRASGGHIEEGKRIPNTDSEGTIAATGRQPRKGGMLGLKAHFSNIPLQDDLEVHLGKYAYVGVSAVEDGFVNVCGLFKSIADGSFKTPQDRFFMTLEQSGFSSLCERLKRGDLRDRSFCSVVGLDYSGPCASGIGDQHAQIPPFTGNGMTMALESAQAVLPLAIHYANGKITWKDLKNTARRQLSRRFGKRLAFARKIHPFLLNPVGQQLAAVGARSGALPFKYLYQITHS